MRLLGTSIAAFALIALALPASAQPKDLSPESMAKHLATVGTWEFEARRKGPDGKSECIETWYFAADGGGWTQSGEQRVTFEWRTAKGDGSDRWLYRTSKTSTSGRDCLGRPSDPSAYPRPESGFVVMFLNSGSAYTCQPAAYIKGPDGKPTEQRFLRDEDCWGSLKPASED